GVRTFTCRRCGETKTARIPRTGSSAPDDIDFTKADDAGKFELVNQAQSAIAEGEGLALIATRPAFEDCKGQNSGDQATIPEDVVKVPVSGDWTATLTVDFDANGARNGYYQFFGFYAAQGEDYQNLAGIRGGDGAMQNFERHDGEITHQDEDGVNSAPGFASAGTYFLRIEKEGDTYTCYRSEDGETFTEMFAYPESGIEADYIIIDAYTGMTEGYKFTLKSLEFEGGSVPMAWVLAETVEAGGQYVIVSNGYALTNQVAEVSTAYGRTSLASTPVTVENEIIISEVSEDMIWDFTAATSSSNNGFETGYVLTSGDSKYLARNGPTNGNPAPLNTQTYDASNYDTKPQYCYWVVEDLDDAGNKAVFCTGTGEWSFALRGSAEGFDAPGNSSAATIVSQNPVQLYELIGKPVEPEEPEEPETPIEYPDLPIYQNKYDYSFAERAADLLARMSLTQKGSMLVENSPAILAENLGGGALNVPATLDISHYCWWSEALHGFLRDNEQPQTDGSRDNVSYAQSLTMASTWNPALYYEGAVLIADEIRERAVKNELGNCINLDFYSPTINMQRDPRWGRNEESYSEDPYLTAVMGSEFVFGMEGKDREGNMLDPDGYYKTMTTIKHYVANNTEAIRQSGGATSDLRALREYYAAPYRDIIQKADCRSVMTAYSSFNGEPCSYSSYLMDTLLRQTYGFSGFITSDCDSVSTMSNLAFVNPRTGEKLTNVEQWGGALAHGEDLECNSGGRSDYRRLTKDMVDNAVQTDKGIFTENTIDVSAHRLLTARISTGELDLENGWTAAANERKADQEARGINNYTPERIAVVDKEVDEGVVMLKNDGILPLQIPASGAYKAVIIGEHQNSSYLGLYSSEQRHAEDDKWRIWIGPGIEQAILAKDPDATVTRIAKNSLTEEEEALVREADVVIVVTGTSNSYSAEGRDRSTIVLPNNQATLISNVGKMNPNTVAVMETCGPMQVTQFENDVKAILWSSFGGIRKGIGFGHVLTGVVNPSGHLTSTWHQNDSDIPGIRDYNLYATNGSHGRTYMYYDNTVPVSYPFGYGLSYTTFEYSNLKIDRTAYDANDTVKVTFDVKNTGAVIGKDVAQLYIAQPDAPAELLRPIRRLEGFDKFELAPGETKTVSLEVAIPDLAFYNEANDRFEVDTGRYQVQVGEDSAHADLTADFTVSGTMDEYPVVLTAKPNQEGDTALGIEERVIFDMG
ncbi:MAG: glycoside hydrolase family 3 C-terminal domain-containing protein, partial [Oscillospiraceae bacterium]|nr:glycoside hydrolase family 3 C-terminal domain-containing protein [Oscillospiraceae bacterium]